MEILIKSTEKLGISLSQKQLNQFERYYRALRDWNDRMNLTSVIQYKEVQITHFLDSLSVTKTLDKSLFDKNLRIVDVGTGAGFPGIPLAIAFPDFRMFLLEVTMKKIRFLQHVLEILELSNVDVVEGRAEEIGHDDSYRESFDIVLSRAVAPLSVLAELTLPFCRIGGCCIAQKKGDITQEISEAKNSIEILGGRLKDTIDIELEELPDRRCLIVIEKCHGTPDKYPRRPGIPAKRPLS